MDRKVLEVILRMTPEKLYVDLGSRLQCGDRSHQEVVREYLTPAVKERIPSLKLHEYYNWVCTRPKGHDGPHVAVWPQPFQLCPIEPWKNV